MFARAAAFSVLALALSAAATPVRRGSCNTGAVQCCNSTHDSSETAISTLVSLLGVDLSGITGKVGLQCSPVSAVGVGSGSSCSAQAVCCQNNNIGGLISVGCLPITL
ncbi:hydrophobin [Epithele typhae]|uniref:hydrophobin n=1 Tax=Epithele typhae TaxID=378194 RepID=UPI0020075EA4|nr:hydrophobin [Epithele typhae]KAH9911365.1 hydrophobin [Epithele typhae]